MGGTRHPSVPQVSPPDYSPLATTHNRYALASIQMWPVQIRRSRNSSDCRTRVSADCLRGPQRYRNLPVRRCRFAAARKPSSLMTRWCVSFRNVLPPGPVRFAVLAVAAARARRATGVLNDSGTSTFRLLSLSAGSTRRCLVHPLLHCLPLPHSALPLDVRVRPIFSSARESLRVSFASNQQLSTFKCHTQVLLQHKSCAHRAVLDPHVHDGLCHRTRHYVSHHFAQ